tara:strand:+ start:251 stop:412 length:162 start_codon:yes stop_codon:yes gene_type:complete
MIKIEKACRDYVEYAKEDNPREYLLDLYKSAIFTAALEHFHGENVWGEINRIM